MVNGFTQNKTVDYWRLFRVTDTIDVGIRTSSEIVYRLNIFLHNGAFSTSLFQQTCSKVTYAKMIRRYRKFAGFMLKNCRVGTVPADTTILKSVTKKEKTATKFISRCPQAL